MKKILFIALGLLFVFGCGKIRPKKVKKKLTDTEWNLVSYVVGDESKATTLTSYTYSFKDNYELEVMSDKKIDAEWEVSLNDDPAVITLSFPAVDGLEVLTDDYKILDFDKDYMRLESIVQVNEDPTILVFRK